MVICPDGSEVPAGIVDAARRKAPDLEVEITTYNDPHRTYMRLSDGAIRTEPYDDDDENEMRIFDDQVSVVGDSPDAGID